MLAIKNFLYKPISIAPLVFFRVAFGSIMLWEVWRYFHYNRVDRYFIQPTYFFHYYGFDWIQPLPGDGMNWLFVGLGVLALAIAIGFFYRLSIFLFWLVFTYIFLLDQTQYLNHFYLVSLISFLMNFVPAHRAWSVDVLLNPEIRSHTVPNWNLWLLRGQMAIVYIYGGIAKINPDWLVGEPMRDWLSSRTDFPLIGHLFTEEWMIYFFSYGGMLFDLLIVPFILWRRTRIPALLIAIGFHLTNHRLFSIGIFPWFALGLTLLYLPPDWFRFRRQSNERLTPEALSPLTIMQKFGIVVIGGFFVIQVLLPLRHFLFLGYASWTEEGHTLAWHMKLRSKGGQTWFFVSQPELGSTHVIDLEDYLTSRQIDKIQDEPRMILRFSHYLSDYYQLAYNSDIEVKVWSVMSLNGRAPQLMIDPTADLTKKADVIASADWILPLVQPPAPHEGYPALLVSGRFDDTLALVNITQVSFPLDDLLDSMSIDTGVEALDVNSCVLLYTNEQTLDTIYPVCNETARLYSTTTLLNFEQSPVEGFDYHCRDETCVIVDTR